MLKIRQQKIYNFWLKIKSQHWTTPHILQICFPQLLPVPEGEVAAEECKIWYKWKIQRAVTDQLNKIPAEDFSNAMKKLETRANLYITSNGSYFE